LGSSAESINNTLKRMAEAALAIKAHALEIPVLSDRGVKTSRKARNRTGTAVAAAD